MIEWICVTEELPPEGTLVTVRKSDGGVFSRVKLIKVPDKDFRNGYMYGWYYKSGLYARLLDNCDQWRQLNENGE